jgi:hypothetical protein
MKPSASHWLEQDPFPITNHLKFLDQLQFSRRLPTVCITEFVLDFVKQRCTVHHFESLFFFYVIFLSLFILLYLIITD